MFRNYNLKLNTTKVQYRLYFINDLTHIRVFPYRPAYHIFEPASRRIHDPVHLVRHCWLKIHDRDFLGQHLLPASQQSLCQCNAENYFSLITRGKLTRSCSISVFSMKPYVNCRFVSRTIFRLGLGFGRENEFCTISICVWKHRLSNLLVMLDCYPGNI